MKRLCAVLMLLFVVSLFCGCAKTGVEKSADVTLTFIYGAENIRVSLADTEAEKVIAILDAKHYDPITSGIPSCGFDKNISLTVGDRVFAIARDTCNEIQDMGNLRYFDIPAEDMEYIRALFEKYGGYFPCI